MILCLVRAILPVVILLLTPGTRMFGMLCHSSHSPSLTWNRNKYDGLPWERHSPRPICSPLPRDRPDGHFKTSRVASWHMQGSIFDRILSTSLAVCAARIQAKEMQLLRHT
ncbi:hypothetical protein EV421DRAFT_1850015 [Armillaria borealis]|uniref:Secreted protein n=1 Tax=Armillaria borealis TaxID=47425 RepID=A0AA39IXG2_9AGAR|nr:hypothetical protein EV421DRAFT_1850015 [Armillaria borealis]